MIGDAVVHSPLRVVMQSPQSHAREGNALRYPSALQIVLQLTPYDDADPNANAY